MLQLKHARPPSPQRLPFHCCSYNLDYYEIDADSVFLLSVTINFDPFIMQVSSRLPGCGCLAAWLPAELLA